jgi:F0F1-type ATP synthase membrane subunit c/vacuolar-type H+-ATPase subunit K
MKNRFIAAAIALLCCTGSFAQKDTCKIGIYINSIYDFKLDDKSYMADFWIWMNYKNDSLAFDNRIEITNGKSADFSHYSMEKKSGWNWAAQKCRAQLIHQWDVSTFPFDKQELRIEIEDSQSDTSRLIYMADEANSKIDSSFNSSEWSIEKFSLSQGVKTYQTTYGNPSLSGRSSYARVVAEITIKRKNSWIKLIKLLTGVYVAFLISCIVFFVSNESQDSRFCLCVGGIFAAIGNKYIVESVVPSSTSNTLMDNVHTLTFIFILLITVVMIISLRLFQSEDTQKKQLSLKVDRWAFYIFTFLYTFLNVMIVYLAAK